MKKKVWSLTTTLPYVNAKPHIGFAFEIVGADILGRYHELKGEKVIFNTGTDEHGQKVYDKARELKLEPQAYCDEMVKDFYRLKELLDLSWTNFVRTTDEHHKQAAREMWCRCRDKGYIYKAIYEVKYCVGCEMEKTESELEGGRCPLHPNMELELRAEENYFFAFSKLRDKLLKLYEDNPEFVRPAGRMTEIKALAESGLKDFSISRLKEKMPWGVAVPDDESQVMYVWFDALTNYISTLGWPEVELKEENGWGAVQVAGKDNLRQQAAMWQAMLLAADLPTSKQILINGFIMVEGQKMSKSLGNVIAPAELVEKFGTEGTRWLLASLGHFGEDSDISWTKLREVYTADLSNGLGNLCSRVAKMAVNMPPYSGERSDIAGEFEQLLDDYDILGGVEWLREKIGEIDKYLSSEQPWLIKDNEEKKKNIIEQAIKRILELTPYIGIYMPKTANIIREHFTNDEGIGPLAPLFERLT
ncbi:methionine--tRNA ligase [Microgenomates group bacterium]|nr:methionine--tRNA ligase [Microgenomates group bacterium]